MSTQANPFATATAATTAPVAPVATTAPAAVEAAVTATPVVEATVTVASASQEVAVDAPKKEKKAKKPNTNKKMEEADKLSIIKRYRSEDIGVIADSMGYTRSQAYNVIRNTRILLTDEIAANPEMTAERRAQIDRILEMVAGKEFGRGGIAGGAAPKTPTEKVNDILTSLLG